MKCELHQNETKRGTASSVKFRLRVFILVCVPFLALAPLRFSNNVFSLNVVVADDDGGGGGGGDDDSSAGGAVGGIGNSDNYGGSGGYSSGTNDQSGSQVGGGYSGGGSAAASSQSDQAAAAAAADTAENTQAQSVTTHAATNATAGMGAGTAGDDDAGSMAHGVAAQRGSGDDDTATGNPAGSMAAGVAAQRGSGDDDDAAPTGVDAAMAQPSFSISMVEGMAEPTTARSEAAARTADGVSGAYAAGQGTVATGAGSEAAATTADGVPGAYAAGLDAEASTYGSFTASYPPSVNVEDRRSFDPTSYTDHIDRAGGVYGEEGDPGWNGDGFTSLGMVDQRTPTPLCGQCSQIGTDIDNLSNAMKAVRSGHAN